MLATSLGSGLGLSCRGQSVPVSGCAVVGWSGDFGSRAGVI
jgi:hypothetical protein